jgi:hypothetical protein
MKHELVESKLIEVKIIYDSYFVPKAEFNGLDSFK